MVYSNKFVMCVLINGTPQKELANGTVQLPFGSEYSLRFRNKNNRRAVVKLYIDGENVSGEGFVVEANSYSDIERPSDIDRAFKFVDLDSPDAVEHGKNGPNNDKVKGTIEARFYLEKEVVKPVEHHHHHHYPTPPPVIINPPQPRPPYRPPYRPYNPPIWYGTDDQYRVTCDMPKGESSGGSVQSMGGASSLSYNSGKSNPYNDGKRRGRSLNRSTLSAMPDEGGLEACTASLGATHDSHSLRDGCTVEGDMTGQRFRTVHVELEETYTTLKIFLQGFDDSTPVQVLSEKKKPAKKRKTNKDKRLDALEAENEEMRRKLAELENEKLKKQLKELDE